MYNVSEVLTVIVAKGSRIGDWEVASQVTFQLESTSEQITVRFSAGIFVSNFLFLSRPLSLLCCGSKSILHIFSVKFTKK